MSWKLITTADVLDELSPQEVAAFNALQGQVTTQEKILQRVVDQARGAIAGGGNQLDAAATIPDQLRNQVIDIALWRWLKKFPALKNLQTKERKDAYDEAMTVMKEVARKNSDYRVELPNPVSAQGNPAPVNAIAVVSQTCRQLTRRETRGL